MPEADLEKEDPVAAETEEMYIVILSSVSCCFCHNCIINWTRCILYVLIEFSGESKDEKNSNHR